MKVDRAALVAILKKIDAGLASKDLVPIFACFCFAEGNVHAFDDVVALRFPAKLGITGGVRGELLLGFLNASRAKEVDITQADGNLVVKSGRAKLETPLFGESDFLFSQPAMKEGVTEVPVDMKFIAGLYQASMAMGQDPAQAWRYGVTVSPAQGGYTLYATDDKQVARAIIGKPEGKAKAPILLPPRFVELLLSISKGDVPKRMTMAEEWGEVRFASGLRLFTKTVTGADPSQYRDLFKHINEAADGKAVDIPKGLDKCLARAGLVTKYVSDGHAPHSRLTVDGAKLRIVTQSSAGDVKDSLATNHGKADVYVAPELVAKVLPLVTKMAIIDECIKLTGKGLTYLISTHATGQGGDTAGSSREE